MRKRKKLTISNPFLTYFPIMAIIIKLAGIIIVYTKAIISFFKPLLINNDASIYII